MQLLRNVFSRNHQNVSRVDRCVTVYGNISVKEMKKRNKKKKRKKRETMGRR